MLIVYTFIVGVTRGISWYVKAYQVCLLVLNYDWITLIICGVNIEQIV